MSDDCGLSVTVLRRAKVIWSQEATSILDAESAGREADNPEYRKDCVCLSLELSCSYLSINSCHACRHAPFAYASLLGFLSSQRDCTCALLAATFNQSSTSQHQRQLFEDCIIMNTIAFT